MKTSLQRPKLPALRMNRGFTLVVTLSLMILLTILAVGLLSLSTVSLRSSSRGAAQAEAQANARLALMIALGELQKEMGPDMRVSAESAMFDSNKETEAIEGVEQSHWLASYNSWGDWLNTNYTPPGGSSLKISDTYDPRREKMFRRWLLSMPLNSETNIKAPDTMAWDNSNSVILVGEGSLGKNSRPDQITRAYLTPIGKTGKHAWWIGSENQKARIDMAKKPRTLSADEWQTAQGDTAEVGVGALTGMQKLDEDSTLGDRLITPQTLRAADVADETVKQHFFDLTGNSQGVLASVRTGHLKKDLSLLLDMDNNNLPSGYKFNSASDVREPSIRPTSPELVAKSPKISVRHLQSWTNLRHYYRMYRATSDATVVPQSNTKGNLEWNANNPLTRVGCQMSFPSSSTVWKGNNHYWRFPILAKLTYIYSLYARPNTFNNGRYDLNIVYTPVLTYWNPYNVEIRIPDNQLGAFVGAPRVWPISALVFKGSTLFQNSSQYTAGSATGNNVVCRLRSGTGGDIVFKPGEFKVFSHNKFVVDQYNEDLMPGFNPLGVQGGDRLALPGGANYLPSENPGVSIRFGIPGASFNINDGNTPGSLCAHQFWGNNTTTALTMMYQNDWFQAAAYPKKGFYQTFAPITRDPVVSLDSSGSAVITSTAARPQYIQRFTFLPFGQPPIPKPVAFVQYVLKCAGQFDYPSINKDIAPNNWYADWRCRNWIQSPPFYNGSAMYISNDDTIANTQRQDCPYMVNFGPLTSMGDAVQLLNPFGDSSIGILGSGPSPVERVAKVSALELPTAPISSLAGFSGMKINPSWASADKIIQYDNPRLRLGGLSGQASPTNEASLYAAEVKIHAYQSGVTGPGVGNSFMHPMLDRRNIYQYYDNSKSQDPVNRSIPNNYQENDNMLFNDYWDHVFLLNDALWDDYFVSSLADQTRPGATSSVNLAANIDRLVAGEKISNSRYRYESGGRTPAEVKTELQAADGYLKAAKSLVVDGMFNVNSTSVAAWHALFAGIRERQAVYRDKNGNLQKITVPKDKRIALTRFDTETSDQDMDDPEGGVTMSDGTPGWSGVRFLDDSQLQMLAEECVKQVKKRGPFLNFAEFINRRLSNDELGTMGSLQSAIDYDDASAKAGSINYNFKSDPGFMLMTSDLGTNGFKTPEAAVGSRFAGIPGYVIQSDLLKPIANTLSVRDDTFRIRAYGESLDTNGKVIARAWCEAIVQRTVDYADSSSTGNLPTDSARLLDISGGTVHPISNAKYGTFFDNDGSVTGNAKLTPLNRTFGRKFRIESFRWLSKDEV